MSPRFHPSELSGSDAGEPTTAELGEALATARALETQLVAGDIHPSMDFVDRVMTAVATEPRPQPAIAAGLAMRGGRIGSMVAALGDSWRVAFSGGRPLAVRAQAAAFVLVAVLAVGSVGGLAVVGAARLLTPPETPPGPAAPSPVIGPTASPSARPTDNLGPTTTPDPSETAEPSETPDARKTPRPNETEKPTDAPEPEATEDSGGDSSGHGGGGSGGGDGPEDN